MSDIVVDSSVVAKWILAEADSPQAQRVITETVVGGGQLIVLDLVIPEVANAIWKRLRRQLLTPREASDSISGLARLPVRIEPAARLLAPAFEIASRYDRAVYDALFVALAQDLGVRGVTADEPLFNSIHTDHPSIILLRDF